MQFGTTEVKRGTIRQCMYMNMPQVKYIQLCVRMCLYSHLHYVLIVLLLVWHQVHN